VIEFYLETIGAGEMKRQFLVGVAISALATGSAMAQTTSAQQIGPSMAATVSFIEQHLEGQTASDSDVVNSNKNVKASCDGLSIDEYRKYPTDTYGNRFKIPLVADFSDNWGPYPGSGGAFRVHCSLCITNTSLGFFGGIKTSTSNEYIVVNSEEMSVRVKAAIAHLQELCTAKTAKPEKSRPEPF
jgi:hypothetical protein